MEYRWHLWRLDDNGQKFPMQSFESLEEAEQTRALFESRGHKQTYWIVDGKSGKSPNAEAEGA